MPAFVGHQPEAVQQAVRTSVCDVTCFTYSNYNKKYLFLTNYARRLNYLPKLAMKYITKIIISMKRYIQAKMEGKIIQEVCQPINKNNVIFWFLSYF